MTCSWSEERFERFLDGDVTGAERVRLLAHVDSCAACTSLLEELRVVDGLLIEPPAVELPPDFVAATMAEVQALPQPVAACPHIAAWLVSFVVAAWSLVAAALLIMPAHTIALAKAGFGIARDVFFAFGGIGHVIGHLSYHGNANTWTVSAVVVADLLILAGVIVAFRIARPRISERLRW